MQNWHNVVIGIPTYRRPRQLRWLLESLARQVPQGARVVVADNDCDPAVEELVATAADELAMSVEYIMVPERGISQVRNALIAAATERVPDWEWIVQYDDDGTVADGALCSLVEGAEQLDADAVAGMVVPIPEVASSPFLRSYLPDCQEQPTGLVEMLSGGQNIALSRGLIERMGSPWFTPRFGLVGGEDYDFFLRAKQHGARLAWISEAVVYEGIPAQRCSARAVLRRTFLENTGKTAIDRNALGTKQMLSSLADDAASAPRNVAAAVVRRDPDRLRACVLQVVGLGGRVLGLTGYKARRYSTPAPESVVGECLQGTGS